MIKRHRKKIFEPFFTTKGEKGTGLGLATVYGIIKQHKGNIWVYSEPGHGTTFKIYLPVIETPHTETTSVVSPSHDLNGSETILLVEDNAYVRDLGQAILKRYGYSPLVARNGVEALSLISSHRGHVHLLLTDVVMPEMNGKDLHEKIMVDDPDMKVLYMSGYTDDIISHHGVLDEGVPFIQKPFSVQKLLSKVRAILDT
ncbi:MAG: response regulator [Desulfobacterales bacterium]|nr:response regulator [Desulfobacterales bacterium]